MSGADGDGNEDATVTTPKKKKRKPKPKPEGGDQAEEAPVSDRSAVSMPEVSRFVCFSISFGCICNAAFIHVWSGIIMCSKQSGTLWDSVIEAHRVEIPKLSTETGRVLLRSLIFVRLCHWGGQSVNSKTEHGYSDSDTGRVLFVL